MKAFTVKYADEVAGKLEDKANVMDDLNPIIENSMKRIQSSAFKRGPVLTGFLTSNLLANENREGSVSSSSVEYRLIDGTDYTLVQEYTNPRKPDFLRSSVTEEGPKLKRDLNRLFTER